MSRSAGTVERPRVGGVDPRIAARRRAVAADRVRRRRRRVGVVGAVLVVVAAALGVTRTPLLDVDRVDVHGGSRTSHEELLATSGVRPGDRMVDIDVGQVGERLRALPWIADASVARDLPGVVVISVTERSPTAVARGPQGAFLADATGRVLAPAVGDEALPALEGVDLVGPGGSLGPQSAGALELIGMLPASVAERIQVVHVAPDGSLTATAVPTGTVVFGSPTDLPEKVLAVETLFAQVDDTDVLTWDVRVPHSATVTRTTQPPPPQGTGPGTGTRPGTGTGGGRGAG